MKRKRIVNKQLLQELAKQRCLVCRRTPCDPHHVKSKKSGGDDVRQNLMPLCREHHTEIHKIGLSTFSEKYKLGKWLIDNGWEFSSMLNKWIKEKDAGVIF